MDVELLDFNREESKKEDIKKVVPETYIEDELDRYKKKFKNNIQLLISEGLLKEAKDIILQYEEIVENDVEIYSMKGIISIMEGDINGAFIIINEGLVIDPNYVDLLYNKAYLLEEMQLYKESYNIYKSILNRVNNAELEESIKNKLSEIKNNDTYVDLNGKLSLLSIDKNLDDESLEYILNWLHDFGFTVLKRINKPYRLENENEVGVYVVLYDLNPVNMKPESHIKFPYIDNERYFLIEKLIKEITLKFGNEKNNEMIYLTENHEKAKKDIEEILGNLQEINIEISEIESNYTSSYKVIKLFDGFRHRAKTELIEYRKGLAVKKTWKPRNERFLEREKYACGELSKRISYIPQLLESGENYIIIPYYENILYRNEQLKKIVLTNQIMDIANFFKELYKEGCFNPDIHPGQFVFSQRDGLKAIDFEYLQHYENKPKLFMESYDIKGCPRDFKGDKPNYTGKNLHGAYDNLWKRYTGYTLEQIASLAQESKYSYDDLEINNVLSLLNYAKTSSKTYNGSFYGSAYHSVKLKGYYFRGQREPNLRLQKVPYDFTGKTVLDIGCNAGGMLHVIADKIKLGVGIDYDYRLINAGNAIKAINKTDTLSFYRFDLEKEELNLIKNYILSETGKVDICFLLSVCMWIKNWREVIGFVASIANNLLFETNGNNQEQLSQIQELKKHYKNIIMVEEESNDDPGQPNRKLLLCTNEKKGQIIVESNIASYENLLNTMFNSEYNIIYKKNTSSKRICKIYVENDEIDFEEYMKNFFDLEFYRNYFNFMEKKDSIKGIITGLSYFETGIDENKLKIPFVNLALSSQDLFYDFSMLKYAIDELENTENIEYVILGISNYSFRYDLSKTQNPNTKEKPRVYYPILRKLHNYKNKYEVINEYTRFEEVFRILFKDKYVESIYRYWEKQFDDVWYNMVNIKFDSNSLNGEKKEREIYLAERWNKTYPDTVKENIGIFREMLEYLNSKNIKVIVVTNPTTNFYKNYFPQNCRKEFLDIISNFNEEFDYTFIDAYEKICFNDENFYDSSHLNILGMEKFTQIINEYLFLDK